MYNIEMFKPRFLANKDCRKMNCLPCPPRMIGSSGTQTKFVSHIVESLGAKFGAFFQSVTIFFPKPPRTPSLFFSWSTLTPSLFFSCQLSPIALFPMVISHPITLSYGELSSHHSFSL